MASAPNKSKPTATAFVQKGPEVFFIFAAKALLPKW
jgi:hypothetical protein